MLKKLQKASESSWHEIWNLSDRTTRRRNEVVSYRKREVTETRNQMYWGRGGGGKEPMVPFIWGVRYRSQPWEPALGTIVDILMMKQQSGSFNEFFMQQALTRGKQKGRRWKMPS